jgi:two-component system nitrogen regulation sensor histidine kinase NtrY
LKIQPTVRGIRRSARVSIFNFQFSIRLTLSTRITLVVTTTAAISLAGAFAAPRIARALELPPNGAYAIAILIALPAVVWSVHAIVRRFTELHAVLGNALSAFRDGDFSLRLAVRGEHEIAELKRLYNELADTVREDRSELHRKEILLDTILQRTPIAVLLLSAADRIIYSNAAARELLAGGARLNGLLLDDLSFATPLRDALASFGDSLFRHEDETFHLTQRIFQINVQPHRLVLLERMTPELRRQEVATWKKAIRVINHEINNTVAPISSLFHSARRAQEMPEHRHRLGEIYGLIEERLAFLRTFLDAYAEFARLPEPRKELVAWSEVLDAVHALYDFRTEGHPALACHIDRAQMQQVLINLVKNAHEAGSDPDEVVVTIERAGNDCVLLVVDRGKGMSEEVMRQALVPFFSTKQGGSGLGLALCNEIIEAHGGRMRLQAREGGGTKVTCWLPA